MKIIYGRAGTGKSEFIFKKIKEEIEKKRGVPNGSNLPKRDVPNGKKGGRR